MTSSSQMKMTRWEVHSVQSSFFIIYTTPQIWIIKETFNDFPVIFFLLSSLSRYMLTVFYFVFAMSVLIILYTFSKFEKYENFNSFLQIFSRFFITRAVQVHEYRIAVVTLKSKSNSFCFSFNSTIFSRLHFSC